MNYWHAKYVELLEHTAAQPRAATDATPLFLATEIRKGIDAGLLDHDPNAAADIADKFAAAFARLGAGHGCPECRHPVSAHHDLAGCARDGCECSHSRATLLCLDDDVTPPSERCPRCGADDCEPGCSAPPAAEQVVPCSYPSQHRPHRWVQLPGHWRMCEGITATEYVKRRAAEPHAPGSCGLDNCPGCGVQSDITAETNDA